MGGWVTAAYRHRTPSCTFKGGFKAGFQSWALAFGSGAITVAATGAGSGLGGWGMARGLVCNTAKDPAATQPRVLHRGVPRL